MLSREMLPVSYERNKVTVKIERWGMQKVDVAGHEKLGEEASVYK
jgi:hypothetical protein